MRFLRQVLLLLQKDALLVWRSKLWLFFELLIELILVLPLIIIIVNVSVCFGNTQQLLLQKAGTDVSRSMIFDPVQVEGGTPDIQREVKNIHRIFHRWCGMNMTLAYRCFYHSWRVLISSS